MQQYSGNSYAHKESGMTSQIVLKYPEQPCSPEDMQDLSCPNLFLNREINWLDFNAKVLDEALSPQQPLLEQLKFLAIFYNNLDEFFMVRVANILRQYRNGAPNGSADRITPAKQLAEIRRRTLLLTSRAQSHWLKSLAPQLLERGVRIVRYTDLSEKQRRFLDGYFRNEIYPVLTPQAIDPGHPFPTISTTCLNFIIQLRNRDNESRFVRLKCPNNLSRFIFIPRNKEAKTYASLPGAALPRPYGGQLRPVPHHPQHRSGDRRGRGRRFAGSRARPGGTAPLRRRGAAGNRPQGLARAGGVPGPAPASATFPDLPHQGAHGLFRVHDPL